MNNVLEENEVELARFYISEGLSNEKIASILSVAPSTISRIRRGKTWKDGNGLLLVSTPSPLSQQEKAEIERALQGYGSIEEIKGVTKPEYERNRYVLRVLRRYRRLLEKKSR